MKSKQRSNFTPKTLSRRSSPQWSGSIFSGKQEVARNYLELFASMRDVNFQFLQRFATEDRVVDDSIVTFEIARAGVWPWPVDAKIEMRLVHIFEARRENLTRAGF